MTTIAIDNKSTVVNDDDVIKMVEAANQWLPLVATAWDVTCPTVAFGSTGTWLFHMIDEDPNTPGALAYHTEENDIVDGYILTKTILNNGGVTLYKDDSTPTVAAAFAHELAEALIDPVCNGWWQVNDSLMYAAEVCDPVQNNNILITLKDGSLVAMSDFILPAWRDSQDTKGPFNYNNTLTAPFTLDNGGYVSQIDVTTGKSTEIYGKTMPEWLQTHKKNSKRIQRRHKHHKKHHHHLLTN